MKITMDKKNRIIVYTDGSSKSNGKKCATGGIGIFFPLNDKNNISLDTRIALSQILANYKLPKITNNVSELTAILFAIKILENNLINKDTIIIKTDSQYSINSLTVWYSSWIRNKWVNSLGKPVLNKEIIQETLNYILKYNSQIIFQKVKAHQKEPNISSLQYKDWYGNNMADYLATNYNKK